MEAKHLNFNTRVVLFLFVFLSGKRSIKEWFQLPTLHSYYHSVEHHIPTHCKNHSSISFETFNNFMENRKPRRNSADQFALPKSAAWAWHERGIHRPISEFHVWRNKIDPKPSRYKLEAMRAKVQAETSKSPPKISSPNYPLFDDYEIERIIRQLHYYSDSPCTKLRRSYSCGAKVETEMAAAVAENKSQKERNKYKVFWSRHDARCGSSINDVIESTNLRSKKGHVAVVMDVEGHVAVVMDVEPMQKFNKSVSAWWSTFKKDIGPMPKFNKSVSARWSTFMKDVGPMPKFNKSVSARWSTFIKIFKLLKKL